MFSFQFLNPRLVPNYDSYYYGRTPHERDATICYRHPIEYCKDLPPNRLRFLGTWFLTPERHFLEWFGVVFISITVLSVFYLFGSTNGIGNGNGKASSPQQQQQQQYYLQPKLWMQLSTVLFYPYVAYTKLSWDNSNYTGRWLLFVGMPVGTLWMISVCYNFTLQRICSIFIKQQQQDLFVSLYQIRYYMIHTIWISFLPPLFVLLPGLYTSMIAVLQSYLIPSNADARYNNSANNKTVGENLYDVCYFCHGYYLCVVPLYYIASGELSSLSTSTNQSMTSTTIKGKTTTHRRWSMIRRCVRIVAAMIRTHVQHQIVGTSILAIYYFGLVTPASIIAGLNVNGMLVPMDGSTNLNFRLKYLVEWFIDGLGYRFILGLVELIRYIVINEWKNKNNTNENSSSVSSTIEECVSVLTNSNTNSSSLPSATNRNNNNPNSDDDDTSSNNSLKIE